MTDSTTNSAPQFLGKRYSYMDFAYSTWNSRTSLFSPLGIGDHPS